MKKEIHPEYMECTVRCSCGNTFTTRSTKSALRIELCNECHPFYTGTQKYVDTGGRVQRFSDKYGSASSAVAEREAARRDAKAKAAEAVEAKARAQREQKAAAKAAKAQEFADKAAVMSREQASQDSEVESTVEQVLAEAEVLSTAIESSMDDASVEEAAEAVEASEAVDTSA